MERVLLLMVIFWFEGRSFARESQKLVYKRTESSERYIYVYKPEGKTTSSILDEYQTFNSLGTSPRTSAFDAKLGMPYIRANTKQLNISQNHIVACEWSAAGCLTAKIAYEIALDDPVGNLGVSPYLGAFVLFNPVIDNSEKGYGYDRIKKYWREFFPMHNITQINVITTLFVIGDSDDFLVSLKYLPMQSKNNMP